MRTRSEDKVFCRYLSLVAFLCPVDTHFFTPFSRVKDQKSFPPSRAGFPRSEHEDLRWFNVLWIKHRKMSRDFFFGSSWLRFRKKALKSFYAKFCNYFRFRIGRICIAKKFLKKLFMITKVKIVGSCLSFAF